MNGEIITNTHEETLNDKFREYIKSKGIKQTFICSELKIADGNLSQMLHKGRTINEEMRKKLNEFLNTNF